MDIMYQKHNCCAWHGGMEGFQSTNNQKNASTTLLPEIEYFFPLKKQQLVLMCVFVFGVVPGVLNMAPYSFRVPRPQTSLEEGD